MKPDASIPAAPVRKGRGMKFLVPLLAVGAALSYLITAGLGKSVLPYMTAEEFLQAGHPSHRLRLTGYVTSGTIERGHDGLSVRFSVGMSETAEQTVAVFYHGTVPDTLKDGSEVVAEGRWNENSFEATTLLAKCPSRYEADLKGEAAAESGGAPQGEAGASAPAPDSV